ncbi:hypothetical protein [Methanobacterium oryzae]|uniref:hypothetical protein n=1 Tax=Methanobacterium oryzae TaxID=69540 RepID=UPI003D20A473
MKAKAPDKFYIFKITDNVTIAQKTNKRTVMLFATIASFLTPFMASLVNVALPQIENELTVNAILLSQITKSFLLTSAIFAVPFEHC